MRDAKFSLAHICLMNADRNPKILWKVLEKIGKEQPEFLVDLEIKLIGKVSGDVLNSIDESNLTSQLNLIDYVPHSEVRGLQQASQILLLVVNDTPNAKGILTGKIFEYLMARRPILAVAPEDGDLAEIINQTESGEVFGFLEMKKLESFILKSYSDYKTGSLEIQSHSIEKYSRRSLTKDMVALFED